MNYTSLLGMLQREEELCRKITTRINILTASKQVEEEGRDISRHKKLLDKATEELDKMLPELFNIRGEIGARLVDLEEIAAQAIIGYLNKPGGDDSEKE